MVCTHLLKLYYTVKAYLKMEFLISAAVVSLYFSPLPMPTSECTHMYAHIWNGGIEVITALYHR